MCSICDHLHQKVPFVTEMFFKLAAYSESRFLGQSLFKIWGLEPV